MILGKNYFNGIENDKVYLGSNLIYSSVVPVVAGVPLTNANFYTARDLWFTNQAQAEATYGLIGDWNTTGVTDMSNAFKVQNNVTSGFNEDISAWDTSNVTTMRSMFQSQTSFNQDIGTWNVSNVTSMYAMFFGATPFNQDIDAWDVSSVTDMEAMFAATSFNQDIGSWDVSNVIMMRGVFYQAASFNQDISAWNVGSATDMSYMFFYALSFNQDIGAWDVSSAINMYQMFRNATVFNQDIGGWAIGNVSSFGNTFKDTSLNTINYDIILIGWEATLQASFPNGSGYSKTPSASFGSAKYTGGSASATARASLISNFGWTIADGGTV